MLWVATCNKKSGFPADTVASRPVFMHVGRPLGARLAGDELQVALVANGVGQLRWVRVDVMLTARLAEDWVHIGTFRRAR